MYALSGTKIMYAHEKENLGTSLLFSSRLHIYYVIVRPQEVKSNAVYSTQHICPCVIVLYV